MNDKINEFRSNDNLKEVFDKLKLDLLYETGHLSDPYEIIKSKSFKKILSKGVDFLPLLMNEIEISQYPIGYTLCLIVLNTIGDDFKKPNNNGNVYELKINLLDWWSKNKGRYAE